jgi:hypothetical protein
VLTCRLDGAGCQQGRLALCYVYYDNNDYVASYERGVLVHIKHQLSQVCDEIK